MELNTVLNIILGLLIVCMVGFIMLINSLERVRKELCPIKNKLNEIETHKMHIYRKIEDIKNEIEDIKDKYHQLACKEEALHNYLEVVPVWIATDETLEELQVALVPKKEND